VVQDDVVWAILAILGGLLLAAGSAVLLRRCMPLLYLRRDLGATDRALIEGAEVFKRDFGGAFPGYSGPSEDAVAKWRDGVEAARDELKKSTFLLDMEDKDWKALRTHIADGEDDVRALRGTGERALGPALDDLKRKRVELTSFLEDNFTEDRPPALVEPIDLLLHGMPLEVGDAEQISKDAKASSALIGRWQALAKQYIGLRQWADVIVDDPSWSPDISSRVEQLRHRLDNIGAGLLDVVKSDEDITTQEISVNLTRSVRDLGVLRRKGIATPPIDAEEGLSDEAVVIELSRHLMAEPGLRVAHVRPAEGGRELTLGLRRAELSSQEKERALRARIQERKWDTISATSSQILEVAVLGIALTLAILAGLQQLYFDKPFGTIQDYLGLVLLGTASAIVTPILANAAKSLAAAGSEIPFLRRKSD
jgi:hypothetical protein